MGEEAVSARARSMRNLRHHHHTAPPLRYDGIDWLEGGRGCRLSAAGLPTADEMRR